MSELKTGDVVSWKTSGGTARGPIERVLTRRAKVGGRTVAATSANPRYVVRNEQTGKSVAKSAGALTPVRGERRGIPTWALAAGLGAVAVAILIAVFVLGGGKAEDGHEFAENAEPALTEIDAQMEEVYSGVANTLSGGDGVKYNIAKFRSHVRGFERTLEAAFAAEEKALGRGGAQIEAARASIEENSAALTGDGRELEDEAAETAEQAQDYVDSSNAFLDDYDAAIAYFEARLKLDRERVLRDTGSGGTSIEDFRKSVVEDVKQLKQLQEEYEDLSPPLGFESIHADLNALARFDIEREQGLAEGLARIGPAGTGVIAASVDEVEDRHLAAYRKAQRKLSSLELNATIAKLQTTSGELAEALNALKTQ